jgi:hypothetical protein
VFLGDAAETRREWRKRKKMSGREAWEGKGLKTTRRPQAS